LKTGGPKDLLQRLLEMGLLEGSAVEVVHEAPFGRDPIAVRVRGALIALRRNEANYIEVEIDSETEKA
jgi:ferrous iron transport protein A